MKTISILATNAALGLLAACANSLPPQDLVEARAEYQRAASGPAAQLQPADLLTAKQQLDSAEAMFNAHGDSTETRDAAYIAIRKAQFAESTARALANERARLNADKTAVAVQGDQLRNAQGQLQAASGQLQATQQALGRTAEDLEREKVARAEAEKKAAQAMADLQKIAAVKKDDRGTVITLSGGVLFKTDKSELQPNAMVQLNQVADALVKSSPDSKIAVEGYTDTQGQPAYNKELSQKRADSVATYLASRGIARDRISSTGFGQDRPVADNTSSDGRAQNRRVEIIITPPATSQHASSN